MNIFKNIIDKRFFLIGLFALTFVMQVLSQPPPPDPGGNNGSPLEGGLIYLLACGIGYGLNKIKSMKKELA